MPNLLRLKLIFQILYFFTNILYLNIVWENRKLLPTEGISS
ncbi:hypothetical protein ACWNT8_08365 [Pigmentibacter ruber]|nr:hypothetical protein [Pigmentibacter ruber]